MRDFFRDGWDFGLFTLIIGLPICAFLLYLLGVSAWEMVTDPIMYWKTWLIVLIWAGFSLRGYVKHRKTGQNDISREVIDG